MPLCGVRGRSTPARLLTWCAIAAALVSTPLRAADDALVVDREAVVTLARANAPAVLRAEGDVQRAEAARVGAGRWSAVNPSVQARTGPRFSERGISPDVGVTAWMPVPLVWDRFRATDAASAGVFARERDVEVARLDAVALALDVYAHVLHAQVVHALASDRAALARELVVTAVARRDAGDVGDLDVELALAERAASEADVSAGLWQLENATQALALALGSEALSPHQVVGDLATLRASVQEFDADAPGVADGLLSAHPRVVAATSEADRARTARAHALTGWLPQIAVGAGYDHEEGAHTPSVGLSTALPSFERGQGARAHASAELSVAEREKDVSERELRVEVVRALRLRAHAEHAVTTLETEALPHAKRALELAHVSYAAGKTDVNAVLQVRRTALAMHATCLSRQLDAALAANHVGLLLGVMGTAQNHPVQEGNTP